MAKSIHLHEIEEPRHDTANQMTGSYWDQWLMGQSPLPPQRRNLDEHAVWKQAIQIGILVAEEAKY